MFEWTFLTWIADIDWLDDLTCSINPSANVFVFGNFNVYHKDWLTYFGGTDRPGELWYNFSISNDLTQMVNIPTWIPGCGCHSIALLDLFISSDVSICSKIAFPLENNWEIWSFWSQFRFHWKIVIMLLAQFPLTFHLIHNGMLRFMA